MGIIFIRKIDKKQVYNWKTNYCSSYQAMWLSKRKFFCKLNKNKDYQCFRAESIIQARFTKPGGGRKKQFRWPAKNESRKLSSWMPRRGTDMASKRFFNAARLLAHLTDYPVQFCLCVSLLLFLCLSLQLFLHSLRQSLLIAWLFIIFFFFFNLYNIFLIFLILFFTSIHKIIFQNYLKNSIYFKNTIKLQKQTQSKPFSVLIQNLIHLRVKTKTNKN